ncbi:hypothetical protein COCON_G00019870 [Conger conger]|uniref:THD domain-containing protein n=1 Tax=Conger conger TaxID=82655 RepID=A0A9Q1I4C1_CONCO|nr:tumor necrosis factor ligand superfamily member 14-like [Conger conger]KAJ8283137.1 hypothetical protein COCON_G00019870 [Conger conger]
MAEGQVACPQVFVVDRPVTGSPTVPRPGHTPLLQQTLIFLLSLALCGLAVEGYFIYRLYQQAVDVPLGTPGRQLGDQKGLVKHSEDERERSGITSQPAKIKASAHLTDLSIPVQPDGVLQWGVNGDAFTREVDLQAGLLQVKKEGLYYIYSKVSFTERSCSMFKHTVVLRTPRYSKDLELMKAKRFSCGPSKAPEDGLLNSYLGGVFSLHASASVFVKVENHTLVRHQDISDNFFGMFMI